MENASEPSLMALAASAFRSKVPIVAFELAEPLAWIAASAIGAPRVMT